MSADRKLTLPEADLLSSYACEVETLAEQLRARAVATKPLRDTGLDETLASLRAITRRVGDVIERNRQPSA